MAKQLDTEHELSTLGAIMGTPSFMAPEQAEGRSRDIGPRTDVYALCAILYDLLTGRAPFKGATVWETVEQVRTREPVAPRQLQPTVPRDLEVICLKGMRKDAQQRYGSALELAEDLRRFLDGQPILARPAPSWERAWKWARREPARAAAAGAVVLALIAVTAGMFFYGLYKDHLATQRQKTLVRQQQLQDELYGLRSSAEGEEEAKHLGVAKEKWLQALALLDHNPDVLEDQLRSRLEAGRDRVIQKIADEAERTRIEEERKEAKRLRLELDKKAQDKLLADQKAFAERLKGFGPLRDQVRFHAVTVRNQDLAADTAIVRRAAPKALEQLGLDVSKAPKDFANGLDPFKPPIADSPERVKQLADECYQLLLAWSAAEVAPSGDANDAEPHPQYALDLLNRAGALAAAHDLKTPQVFHLRRARCFTLLDKEAEAKTERESAAALAPNSTIDLFETALDHYRKGEVDQAAADCERVFQQEPNHFWAQYVASLCNLQKKDWPLALVRLNACLEQRPDDPWLLMHRALAYAGAAKLDQASADFDKALGRSDDPAFRADLLTNRAFLWMRLGRWSDAEQDLLKAIDPRAKDPRLLAALAGVYQNLDRTPDAIKAMDEAIKIRPDHAAWYAVRARLELTSGNPKAARQDFEAYVTHETKRSSDWARVRVELARLKLKEGELDQALADCDAVLAVMPNFSTAHGERAEVLLRLNRPELHVDAGRALDCYLATGGKPTLEILRARGLLYLRFLKYTEAVEAFTRALALGEDAETHNLRGFAYLALEASKPALADFNAALRLQPSHAESLRGRATALFLHRWTAENDAAAEEAAEAALSHGAQKAESVFQVACVYGVAAGQRVTEGGGIRYQKRALELLSEALKLLPDQAGREAFWQKRVEKNTAFYPIRSAPGWPELARLYGSR